MPTPSQKLVDLSELAHGMGVGLFRANGYIVCQNGKSNYVATLKDVEKQLNRIKQEAEAVQNGEIY